MEEVERKAFWRDLMEFPPERFRLTKTFFPPRKPSLFSKDVCYAFAQVDYFCKETEVQGSVCFRIPREFY